MKEFANCPGDKPFCCNVDGCSMKFTNEDHLAIHKKRHDMTLNLNLGPKTFADQTPTPTQFIMNCEELDLFHDLLNVNPFEETFKKAVEAVRSGQQMPIGKTPTNPPDDTLHTPKVFPHIMDTPNLNPTESFLKTENIPPCEDGLLKRELPEHEKLCPAVIPPDSTAVQTQAPTTPQETVNPPSENQTVEDSNKVILNVPEGHFVQLLTPDTTHASCNMVVIKNPVDSIFPLSVKEKLKKSLSEKKTKKCLQQKVPILKCPAKKTNLSSKFSKFSKNAMKMISKLEGSGNEVDDSNDVPRRKRKKNEKCQSKESRSEFLARSRAASSRCREKKKMYVLYLEKVNNELTTANQNLQLINSFLWEKLTDLHAELLKHKDCTASDGNTEAVLASTGNFIGRKTPVEKESTEILSQGLESPEHIMSPATCPSPEALPGPELTLNDPSFSFDVAEVILDNGIEDSEIPLSEGNKPPDIIVRFNSVGNEIPSKIPLDTQLDRYLEAAEDSVKQIYSEHSYYFKRTGDIEKRIMNYKTFRETLHSVPEDCKKLMKKNDAFRDITSLNTKVLLGSRTPPPLILLKPFKKRSLPNKQTEKT